MSYDYTLTVKNKKDDKILGKAFCNEIKNITLSSKFIEKLHGNIYGTSKMTFTVNEAYSLIDDIENTIKNEYGKILEKKLLSASAANVEIKRDFEEEILEINEYITELFCMQSSISKIIGKINAICEDMFHYNTEKNEWEYDSDKYPVVYDWDVIAEIS